MPYFVFMADGGPPNIVGPGVADPPTSPSQRACMYVPLGVDNCAIGWGVPNFVYVINSNYVAIKKHKLWNKWKQNNDDGIEIQYKKQVNKASKAVKTAKRNFERKLAKDIKQDSKSFFYICEIKNKS